LIVNDCDSCAGDDGCEMNCSMPMKMDLIYDGDATFDGF